MHIDAAERTRIMILGMSTSMFTLVHVLISLTGIGSGFVVVLGMLKCKRRDGWTAIFVITSMLTSLTGFLFPFEQLLPSHILGLLWLLVYVVAIAIALYLNCFAAVVQLFAKIPALKALAPTQTEPPFLIAQSLVLAVFLVLTYLAAKRFRVAPVRDL